jgi:hypothetical protein
MCLATTTTTTTTTTKVRLRLTSEMDAEETNLYNAKSKFQRLSNLREQQLVEEEEGGGGGGGRYGNNQGVTVSLGMVEKAQEEVAEVEAKIAALEADLLQVLVVCVGGVDECREGIDI